MACEYCSTFDKYGCGKRFGDGLNYGSIDKDDEGNFVLRIRFGAKDESRDIGCNTFIYIRGMKHCLFCGEKLGGDV